MMNNPLEQNVLLQVTQFRVCIKVVKILTGSLEYMIV